MLVFIQKSNVSHWRKGLTNCSLTVRPRCRLFRVRKPQISGISDSTLPKNNPFRQYVVDLDRNSLIRLDDLPFAFENGRCANINNEYGLLCSPLDGFKNCWIFDGLYNQTYRWSVLRIGKMSLKSSDGARELPNLVDTQSKAPHTFTILVGFHLLVDLKQLFWVVNFLIHLLFFRQEILSGLTVKILIMGRFIWLISPPFILIILACTFSVDKVRGTRTFSRLLYLFNRYIKSIVW